MCYSASIINNLQNLEKAHKAQVSSQLWKKVYETERITPSKIKLPNLDNRIFPKYIAPIIHYKSGKKVIEPMYYSANPPSYMSRKHSQNLTTFNARKDSLNKRFWSESIGINHGLIVIDGFYEWVTVKNLIKAGVASIEDVKNQFNRQSEQRKQKWLQSGRDINKYKLSKAELTDPLFRQIIIEFKARNNKLLNVPVIFTPNHQDSDDFYGFAIITDSPNPEIAATGHDRMPINLSHTNSEKWLQAPGKNLTEITKIFDNQQSEYYDHDILKAA